MEGTNLAMTVKSLLQLLQTSTSTRVYNKDKYLLIITKGPVISTVIQTNFINVAMSILIVCMRHIFCD